MAANKKPTIDRIDHGVLPSNDLGRAHRFYSTFMGGELDHLTNLNLRGLNREVPQILFYTLANHKGWGLALQDFPISPNPARPLEGVVYGFEVAADNLAEIVKAAEARNIRLHGPATYDEPSPVKESLFVLDPDGNTLEFAVRRDPIDEKPQGQDCAAAPHQPCARRSYGLGARQNLVSRHLRSKRGKTSAGRGTGHA